MNGLIASNGGFVFLGEIIRESVIRPMGPRTERHGMISDRGREPAAGSTVT